MAFEGAPPSVLVVEDDETLRFTLVHNLKREGYDVVSAARGDDGLRLASERRPDLVVLDLMLPGVNGMQVCRLLRKSTNVPIIMLTALGGESDRVAGLDMGADDYLAKPFGMRELLARVRALLRRAGDAPAPAGAPGKLGSGDLELEVDRRQARRAGVDLHLKPKEFDLLRFFLQNPGRVVSREKILDEVWGYDFAGGARTVDVHISWLRKKVEDRGGAPRIRTVRGRGYLFEG
jgi:DNA-binding response OmpR family regulator